MRACVDYVIRFCGKFQLIVISYSFLLLPVTDELHYLEFILCDLGSSEDYLMLI